MTSDDRDDRDDRRHHGSEPGGGQEHGAEPRVLPFPSDDDTEGADDEALARLLELAGPRPKPREEVRRQARREAHAAWREMVERHGRSRRRRTWQLAAAAVLAVGVGIALWLGRGPAGPSPAGPTVARVEAVVGSATVRTLTPRALLPAAESEPVPLAAGDALPAGSVLDTGGPDTGGTPGGDPGGRAALRLGDGTSVRLDRGSRVRLASARELILERGAVYLDTSYGADTRPGAPETPAGKAFRQALAVRTPLGVARDVGTQFEVRLGGDSLRVRVREGRVEVDTGARSHAAAAGVALTVDRRGRVERSSIATHGTAWGWVQAASPPLELEGATLAQYLRWLARETGWRIRWVDPELRREAAEITLHGSIEGLRPDQTPAAVLPGAGLTYRLEGRVLSVERQDGR